MNEKYLRIHKLWIFFCNDGGGEDAISRILIEVIGFYLSVSNVLTHVWGDLSFVSLFI